MPPKNTTNPDVDAIVTSEYVADLCGGINRSWVAKIWAEAKLSSANGVTLRDGVRAVFAHYMAESESASRGLEAEKTRLTAAQARLAEIELDKARGNKVDLGEITLVIQKILTVFRRGLDRLPDELSGPVQGCNTAEAKAVIRARVNRLLEELHSENTLGEFTKQANPTD